MNAMNVVNYLLHALKMSLNLSYVPLEELKSLSVRVFTLFTLGLTSVDNNKATE